MATVKELRELDSKELRARAAELEQAMFELQARIVRGWAATTGRGPIRAPLPGTGGEARDSGGRR